jgi:hypothetical protein
VSNTPQLLDHHRTSPPIDTRSMLNGGERPLQVHQRRHEAPPTGIRRTPGSITTARAYAECSPRKGVSSLPLYLSSQWKSKQHINVHLYAYIFHSDVNSHPLLRDNHLICAAKSILGLPALLPVVCSILLSCTGTCGHAQDSV